MARGSTIRVAGGVVALSMLAGAMPAVASGVWTVVPSPSVGTDINELQAISALAPDDAWAAGFFRAGGRYRTLTQHWDGTSWSIVASPNVGDEGSFLAGVAALTSDDVWAVGRASSGLVEHWNGTRWNVVPSPVPNGSSSAALNAVDALSPTNVWAVGSSTRSSFTTRTLIEHWNGTRWRVVPSPSPAPDRNVLLGVAAASPTDVWAVGSQREGTRTLTEHWNGAAWSIVPSPNPDRQTANDDLFGVSAISSTDVWAVGGSSNGRTLTEHWDGLRWRAVPSPDPSPIRNMLSATEALADGTVWAVGGRSRPGAGQDRTLVLETGR